MGRDGETNGFVNVVISVGQEKRKALAANAGLTMFLPRPPKIILTTIMAKKALARDAMSHNENEYYAKLEDELLELINKTGIGPQGFGGSTTAISVNIETAPTHIAGMPCAVNISCHASRHLTKII